MVRILFAVACAGLICSVAAISTPASAQESDKLLTEVKAAWEKRQNAIRSLKVSWKSKTLVPKGSLPAALARDQPTVKGAPVEVPPTDVTHEGTGELTTQGKKARVEIQDATWDGIAGKLVPCRRESAFEGTRFTRLLRPESHWPTAVIAKDTHNRDGADLMIWPLLLCARSMDSDLTRSGFSLGRYDQARRVTLDGQDSVELTGLRNETSGEVKIYVTPSQAMAFRRAEVFDRAGNLSFRVTFTQQKVADPDIGYLPHQWTVRTYAVKNKLVRQIEVTTTAIAVNPAIQETDFTIAFPPDTRVTDEINQTEYIARGDGTKRDILPEERTAKHEDLVRTNTGELAPGAGGPRRHAPYWIGGGLLVGSLSLLLIFKRRRGRPTPQ
jgi:hypothetical protein